MLYWLLVLLLQLFDTKRVQHEAQALLPYTAPQRL
jgi:hypothetical protein